MSRTLKSRSAVLLQELTVSIMERQSVRVLSISQDKPAIS